MLNASAAVAELAIRLESLSSQMHECVGRRQQATSERIAVSDELNSVRRRALKLRDKEHRLSLSAEQVRHERRTLVDRLREDYRIELAELIWRKVNGPERPFAYVSDPPFEHDVQLRVPDTRKAERVLGFQATTSLESMLDEVIPWIRDELEAGRL